MKPRHYIDAPVSIDGITSADAIDRSDMAHFYPTLKKDDRPLIMSDLERHRQHDEALIKQTRKIHRKVIPLGILLVFPFIVFVNAAVFFFFTMDQANAPILSTLALLAGLAWVGIWILCYRAIVRQFSLHGLRAGPYFFFGLFFLLAASPVLSLLSSISSVAWLNALLFSGYLSIASIVVTEIMLATATHSFAVKTRHH